MKNIQITHILKKQASMDEYVNMLVKAFKDVIDPNDPFTSILQLITEGFIYSKFGFAGGIVAMILDKVFHVNVKTILATIKSLLASFFKSNNRDSHVDVESASTNLANQAMATLGINRAEADKPLEQLQNENPELKSSANAFNNYKINKYSSPLFIKEAGIFSSIMGLTFMGFIKSIFKAALIGTGFSATGNLLAGSGSGNGVAGNNIATTTKPTPSIPTLSDDIKNKSILKYIGNSSGDGLEYFENDANINDEAGKTWYILSEGNFSDYIFEWVDAIYPNMDDKIQNLLMVNLPKVIPNIKKEFTKWNSTVNIDQQYTKIRVPATINNIEMHCVKDIVDLTLSLIKISQ